MLAHTECTTGHEGFKMKRVDQKLTPNASKLAHIHVPQCSVTDQCLSRPGGTRALMFAEIRENHLG